MANKNKKIKRPPSSKGNRCFLWGSFLTLTAACVVFSSDGTAAGNESTKLEIMMETLKIDNFVSEKDKKREKELSAEEIESSHRQTVTLLVGIWEDSYPLMTKKERQQLFSLFGGGVEKWLTPEDIDYANPIFSKEVKKELSKLVQGFFLRAHGCLSKEERKKILDSVGDLSMQVHRRKAGL